MSVALNQQAGPITPSSGTASRMIARSISIALLIAVPVACLSSMADPKMARAAAIAGACLVLWLTELIPLFATTLVLWVATVLFLAPLDATAFGLPRTLRVLGNPVLALFFGGFILSISGTKYGIDTAIANWMVRLSFGRRRALLFTVMTGTAVLSMWISNIAAAAMMIATLRPVFQRETESGFRKALLLGVAFAANFGGIGTPIGTGPNLIAIGSLADRYPISFAGWMLFGVPTAALMTAFAFALLIMRYRVGGAMSDCSFSLRHLSPAGRWVVGLFCATVLAWLLEPLHGLPSALVALAAACALFAARLLDVRDFAAVRWGTLLLIAGGLSLGELFDESGLATASADMINWGALSPFVLVAVLASGCALVSAVSSNTAATAMLIPIAMGISSEPAVVIAVALGASMGAPFVISTPANAMAYGEGELRSSDFIVPGSILMLVGCIGVALLVEHLA